MARQASSVILCAKVGLLSFCVAGTAVAGPFDPAYRGDPNSVHAIFDWVGVGVGAWDTTSFSTGPSIYPLDSVTPMASDDGLNMRIDMPNFIDQLPVKFMRIQFLFDGPVPGSSINPLVIAFDPLPTTVNLVGGSGPGLAAAHYLDYEIFPNPDWEQIVVPGDATTNMVPGNLLRIEIDTISIPSPGAAVLIAVAGPMLLPRRR